jgi:hypothetical protein
LDNAARLQPFGKASPEAIWSAVYAYRSSVAHGKAPDFKGNNKLKVLVSSDRAIRLVINATKGVLRYSLEEPDFMHKLQES